jgi:hypothetical protein
MAAVFNGAAWWNLIKSLEIINSPIIVEFRFLAGGATMSLMRASCLCGRTICNHRPSHKPQQLPLFNVPEAAFRSRARVRIADFNWVQGEELVKYYESSVGTYRGFCTTCGSPIINKFDARSESASIDPAAASQYGIAFGTFDDDPEVRPAAHIFVASKAIWFSITDDLPQFSERQPT